MTPGAAFVLIGLSTILGLAALLLASYNHLVLLDRRCATALADIDAHLKHRQNLIPSLVETVRAYAEHERDTLGEFVAARVAIVGGGEAGLASDRPSPDALVALLRSADRLPSLAASTHFQDLRRGLTEAENRITASRRFYNLAVEEYDAALTQFPGEIITRFRPMQPRRPFDLGFERVLLDEPMALRF